MAPLPPMFQDVAKNQRVKLIDFKAGTRRDGTKFNQDFFDIHVKIQQASETESPVFIIDSIAKGKKTSNTPSEAEKSVGMWMSEAERFNATLETVPKFLKNEPPSVAPGVDVDNAPTVA